MRKIFLVVFAIFAAVFLGTMVLLFSESGRNFLITHAMKCFFQDRVTISVSEIDPLVSNIGLVTVKTIDGVSVQLKKIEVNRKGFFGVPYFKIENANLVYKVNPEISKKTNSKDHTQSETKNLYEKVNYIARLIPLFTLGVEIQKFTASIDDKTYHFHDIKFLSEDLALNLCSDEYGKFSAQLNIGIVKSPGVTINFSNCYETSGILVVDDICSIREKKFHLIAERGLYHIDAFGDFIKPGEKITIDKGLISRQNDLINFSGVFYTKNKKFKAKIPVELQYIPTVTKIISKLPKQAAYDVRKYSDKTILNVSTSLDKEYFTNLDLEKNGKTIVSANVSCFKSGVKVLADLHKMSVANFTINHLNADISENKISAILFGKDFDIRAVLDKNNKDFKVSKFNITSKFGKINLRTPIELPLDFLKKNFVRLEFNIEDFGFLGGGFFGLKGNGKGEIEYSGILNVFDVNALKLKMFSSQISCGNFCGENVSLNLQGKQGSFSSDKIKIGEVQLKKFFGKFQQNNFDIKCLAHKRNEMSIQGKISDDFRKFSISNGVVNQGKKLLKIQNSTMNFADNSFSVSGIFPGHKKKSSFKFEFNPTKCYFHFVDIHLQDFAKIVGSHAHGLLNGTISLRNVGGFFQGRGNLSFLNVLTSNNVTNIEVLFQRNGINFNSVIRKREHGVNIDFFFPVALNSNMKMSRTNGKLMAHIYGKNKLENFFELPDKSSLQGEFDCDCYLSGSLNKPQISGKLSIKNMLIVVNSVILSNGKLDFIGDGDKFYVKSAKFIDNQKNIATATGHGRLFFNNFCPNLDVNLDLDFNRFFVLNSDTTRVQVIGKGKMCGPIDNLKLSGDLIVPYAEITYLASDDGLAQSKIEYENDPFLSQKNKDEKNNNSFFEFDIKMHCKKIKVGGKNFVLFLKGDLDLSMFEKQDTLVGELLLIDGTMNLFGKRMKFVKGNVSFFRNHPYDPEAFFLCRKNFGNMLVSMEIKNSVKKGGSIVLSSNPNYSQDVILSQMLFNKDTRSLSTGEAAQLVQAVSGLKNQGYLFSILGAFSNIGLWDNISFSSDSGKYSTSLNTDTQTSTQQVNISAGKYLQDNVYMSLNKKNDKATFDIDLSVSPTISVKANTAGEVGLNWKYRY